VGCSSLRHLLVEEHPQQHGERIGVEKVVGLGTASDGEISLREVLSAHGALAPGRPKECNMKQLFVRVVVFTAVCGAALVGVAEAASAKLAGNHCEPVIEDD